MESIFRLRSPLRVSFHLRIFAGIDLGNRLCLWTNSEQKELNAYKKVLVQIKHRLFWEICDVYYVFLATRLNCKAEFDNSIWTLVSLNT